LTGTTWIDEPFGTLWITTTSGRGAGGGSSKVKSIVKLETKDIGCLVPKNLTVSTTSDTARRLRKALVGSGFVLQSASGIITAKSIAVDDVDPGKKSIVKVIGGGQYPFTVGGLWGQ